MFDATYAILIVILVIIFAALFIFLGIFFVRRKRIYKKVVDEWNRFVRGEEYPPFLFDEVRQLSLKKYTGQNAVNFECEGVFAIAIYDEGRFYFGESKKIINSINMQLKGRGNKELYNDLQKNGVIWIKAFAYRFLDADERETIKDRLIKEYTEKGLVQYGKKKPVESTRTNIKPSENKSTSYLNHKLTVTGMVRIVHQPRGGFINPLNMDEHFLLQRDLLRYESLFSPYLKG